MYLGKRGGKQATKVPLVRQRLADLAIRVEMMKLEGYRQLTDTLRKRPPGINASVNKLEIQERASKRPLLGWSALRASGIAYRHAPQRLVIERIDTSGPFAKVEIGEDGRMSLVEALKAPGAAPSPPASGTEVAAAADAKSTPKKAPSEPPMPIEVRTLTLEKGKLPAGMWVPDQGVDPYRGRG